MYCKHCGTKMEEGAKFCPNCGSVGEEANTTSTPVNPVPPMEGTVSSNGKKKNDGIFIAVIAIVGILLIAVPILINTLGGSSDNSKVSHSNGVSKLENPKRVTFKKFSFEVPGKSTTEVDGDSLYIYNLRTENEIGILGVQAGDYDQLKSSKEYVKSYMQSSGYSVTEVETDTYNGVEFLIAPVTQNGASMILAYAKLNDDYVAMVVVANQSYTFDYSLLNEMSLVVGSAKAL